MRIDASEGIRRNLGLALVCFALFLLGIPPGYFLHDDSSEYLDPALGQLKDLISDRPKFESAIMIFWNNLRVCLIMLVLGTLIIPALLVMLTNGFVIGYIIRAMDEKGIGLDIFFKAVAAHSVFELPALFLSAALGLRIGLSFMTLNRRKMAAQVSRSVREGIATHFLAVLPLLLIASFVEVYVSAALVGQ